MSRGRLLQWGGGGCHFLIGLVWESGCLSQLENTQRHPGADSVGGLREAKPDACGKLSGIASLSPTYDGCRESRDARGSIPMRATLTRA